MNVYEINFRKKVIVIAKSISEAIKIIFKCYSIQTDKNKVKQIEGYTLLSKIKLITKEERSTSFYEVLQKNSKNRHSMIIENINSNTYKVVYSIKN